MSYILEYNDAIQSGIIVASKRVRQMYQKLASEVESGCGEWVYDSKKADRPVQFIETFCRHSKGEWIGKPVTLELFQKAYINALFGFIHRESGERRFKETMFLVARKNGKSTMLSGIALYMLVADGEGGPEVYSVATKRDQAKIVFTEAVNMVRQSPELSQYLKKRVTDIYFPMTYGKFVALASDSNSLDGLNSHAVIIDELHAIKDRSLYEVMKQSMSARRQPMLVMITTAGTVRENIFDDLYDYSCKVCDGQFKDDRFLPILYELDSKNEWTDYQCWMKANPGLGTIKKVSDLSEKVERAKNHANDLPGILTKDFNVRETVAGTWLTFDTVNNEATFSMDDIRGSYAIGGVDLSSTTDLTCATLFILKPDGRRFVLQQYFLPSERVEFKVREDKIPYDRWSERGLVKLSEGNKVNYADVTNWFVDMIREYEIRPLWVGYDPWNSTYWTEEMKNLGFNMVIVRQGARTMSQPMKELAAELDAKTINYNNNPVLKWCLTNTSVKRDENDNIRPIKGANSRQRIDGTVSLIIAYTVFFEKMSDYRALIEG